VSYLSITGTVLPWYKPLAKVSLQIKDNPNGSLVEEGLATVRIWAQIIPFMEASHCKCELFT